jgi:hypothetical protein
MECIPEGKDENGKATDAGLQKGGKKIIRRTKAMKLQGNGEGWS